jgi:hypothetical protein
MTALTAHPPVLLHPLADRQGTPAALLLDVDRTADEAHVHLAAQLLAPMLHPLAAGGMGCFYRAGAPQAVADLLAQAGWQALAPDQLQRLDSPALPATGAPWTEGEWFMAPPPSPVGAQVASRALALQLVQLVSADADTHEIEAVLRQDPTLSYHLLRLVNSLAIGGNAGAGRRVTSFSQAILILGRVQLRRWLNLMLFSSREGDRRSPMLLARVAVRARTMELLARDTGLSRNQQELAFMVGMFSLLGVLFGMALTEVLKPLTISEAVQQALLAHEGELGQLLALVEAAERDDHQALAPALLALQVDPARFSQNVVDAYLWMQAIAAGKTGSARNAGKADARHA